MTRTRDARFEQIQCDALRRQLNGQVVPNAKVQNVASTKGPARSAPAADPQARWLLDSLDRIHIRLKGSWSATQPISMETLIDYHLTIMVMLFVSIPTAFFSVPVAVSILMTFPLVLPPRLALTRRRRGGPMLAIAMSGPLACATAVYLLANRALADESDPYAVVAAALVGGVTVVTVVALKAVFAISRAGLSEAEILASEASERRFLGKPSAFNHCGGDVPCGGWAEFRVCPQIDEGCLIGTPQ